MAMTHEQNELLTRVEGDAPMGVMLRQCHWFPAIPSATLVADGRPHRVRLLGRNYAAFRATDGTVGVVDEQCPHRKASLLLARNEHNGLRCIYHGWKFNTRGELLEAPNHAGDQAQFCRHVRVRRYAVRERAGIVWVWLGEGKGDAPPPFPALPILDLPEGHTAVSSQEVSTNWLQGVEATMDTTHVSFLHSTTVLLTAGPKGNQRVHMTESRAPRLEFEDHPFGYRYAAIRALPDGRHYVRINHFVLPWYGVICPPDDGANAMAFLSVPVDDTHHRAWFIAYNATRPLGVSPMVLVSDPWNFPPLPPGTPADNWGQNRALMARGHFSGFPQHLGTEDFAMFLGQGPIHDRTDEQLTSADTAVVRLRQCLLKAVDGYRQGHGARWADEAAAACSQVRSIGGVVADPADWRALLRADGVTGGSDLPQGHREVQSHKADLD
jgi:phthalate 4,5-dioxygenase